MCRRFWHYQKSITTAHTAQELVIRFFKALFIDFKLDYSSPAPFAKLITVHPRHSQNASSTLSAALQICYHTITNASRRSHCGGLESCRLRDPPQAKNPAKQDSFLLIEWRSLRSFPCTDSHASMESVHRKLRVNCNIKIGCICQKSLVHCRLISCDIF